MDFPKVESIKSKIPTVKEIKSKIPAVKEIKSKFPNVKDIRSKLSSAKLIGSVGKNYLQFKLRRTALNRFKSKEFDVVVSDMDGTLYDSDVSLEGLKVMYPKEKKGITRGEEIYGSLISKIANGEYSIEEATVKGNKFLISKKMNRKDFEKVFENIKLGLREPIILAFKKMKKEGKILVLATLSSKEFGEILNSYFEKKFGFCFDIVVGTELEYDSNDFIKGIKHLVGTKDGDYKGIPVKTKLSAIRDSLALKGVAVDMARTILITDSYGDIDIAKMFVTILLAPEDSSTAQKVSQKLKLADYIVKVESTLQKKLEEIILE